MSFFSKGSKNKHYPSGHKGSGQYQKKGFMGNILNMIQSNSNSRGNNKTWQQQSQTNQPFATPQINALQSNLSCVKCHVSVPNGSKFCLNCGERISVESICSCGQKLPVNAKFCLECGKKTNG